MCISSCWPVPSALHTLLIMHQGFMDEERCGNNLNENNITLNLYWFQDFASKALLLIAHVTEIYTQGEPIHSDVILILAHLSHPLDVFCLHCLHNHSSLFSVLLTVAQHPLIIFKSAPLPIILIRTTGRHHWNQKLFPSLEKNEGELWAFKI